MYKVQVQVKFTLQQAAKAQRESRGIVLLFLLPWPYMGWVVNPMPRLLYPWHKPGTHCIGGWVGPRAVLDRCGKCCPQQDSISRLSSL